MNADVDGTSPARPPALPPRFGCLMAFYFGSLVLTLCSSMLPIYGPDAAARSTLGHISQCLVNVGILGVLSFSHIGMPFRPTPHWLLPTWRALAAAELFVTLVTLTSFVFQTAILGLPSEVLLQVAIVGIWICVVSGVLLAPQGRTGPRARRRGTRSPATSSQRDWSLTRSGTDTARPDCCDKVEDATHLSLHSGT